MNLRRKLFTIFGGLALLALATAGVTLWAIAQWQATEEKLQNHYQRSLLLQRVRAATFRATREVSDALIDGDSDAAAEFAAALEPVEQDFQRWASLADSAEEKQQVAQIWQAHKNLVEDAQLVFQLLESGRRQEAFRLTEGRLEEVDFRRFENLTEQAVASDQDYRKVILAQTQNTRQTEQLVLAIAAFGILSLILLLAAYLASDLFAPLRETEQALDEVARGNLQRRLAADRDDELGAIHHAFNRMIAAIAEREQVLGLAAISTQEAEDGASPPNWQHIPSRLTLHTLVSQLRSRVTQLSNNVEGNGDGHSDSNGQSTVAIAQKALVNQLDQLLQAVVRVTEFGFPLDLNLARTDIRALLYEVLLRFHEDFSQRNISYELQITPDVSHATVDRLKLREALGELVRNALAALPEQGGRLGIRSSLTTEGTELLIEVADDGTGIEQSLIDQTLDTLETPAQEQPNGGLKFTKAIVEQHGGQLMIDSEPGQGTYVQIRLPLTS